MFHFSYENIFIKSYGLQNILQPAGKTSSCMKPIWSGGNLVHILNISKASLDIVFISPEIREYSLLENVFVTFQSVKLSLPPVQFIGLARFR